MRNSALVGLSLPALSLLFTVALSAQSITGDLVVNGPIPAAPL